MTRRAWAAIVAAPVAAVAVFEAALLALPIGKAPATLIAASAGFTVALGTLRGTRIAGLGKALVHHPPKPASEVDPQKLGVAYSQIAERFANGSGPPYIERDVDDALDEAIAQSRFVVLRGHPRAGKSRAALEAIKRSGDPLLVALRPNGSVAQVVTDLSWPEDEPVVLWLDRLERYVRNGGFSAAVRDEIMDKGNVTIVGTIENRHWNAIRYTGGDEDASGLYESADALLRAHEVELGPPTPAELTRARDEYPGESFSDGIGEHLVGANELRAHYSAGSREDTAVLRAVAAWQRTGTSQPISRDQLEQLHLAYLDGADADGMLDHGIKWANQPVRAGLRLLDHESDGILAKSQYRTPDHIVEFLTKRHEAPIDALAWELAIVDAKAADALAIGARAHELAGDEERGKPARRALDGQARVALERARSKSQPGRPTHTQASSRLATVMRRLGDKAAAESLYKEAIEGGSRTAYNNYGYSLMRDDRLEEAEQVLTAAAALGNRTACFNLLRTLAKREMVDPPDHAESLYRPAIDIGNPAAALMLGNVYHGCDDLGEADLLYQAAERGRREADVKFTGRARVLRGLIAHRQQRPELALALFREGWDPEQWAHVQTRLAHVGLAESLEADKDVLLAQLAD